MTEDLAAIEGRFDDAMMNVYRRALDECHYNAARFLQMLYAHRGLEAARILLHASNVSEGYVALWERMVSPHRLATVGAFVLGHVLVQPEFPSCATASTNASFLGHRSFFTLPSFFHGCFLGDPTETTPVLLCYSKA